MAEATLTLCSVDDCGRPSRARGWCHKHYMRWNNTGSPHIVRKAGPKAPGSGPTTYRAMHKRVRRHRGRPEDHFCVSCWAVLAEQWAYDHSDPNALCERGLSYSLDPMHYVPMCTQCHVRHDNARLAP